MNPFEQDIVFHTCQTVPDRADPTIQFCTLCGACHGTPAGMQYTTAGPDLEPPFGHPTNTTPFTPIQPGDTGVAA